MTQAEQVKAKIIETVTGVAPTIHAEAAYGEMSVLEAADNPNHPSHAQSAQEAAPNDEALDAFRLGFPNVFVYRAFKALEARVAKLEAR